MSSVHLGARLPNSKEQPSMYVPSCPGRNQRTWRNGWFGAGFGIHKINLEYVLYQKARTCSKNGGALSNGHRSQLEGAAEDKPGAI